MTCAFCEYRVVEPRPDCVLCAAGVDVRRGLCPEELEGGKEPAQAWFVDPWCRILPVAEGTLIGRTGDLSIRRSRVSRKHAVLTRQDGAWSVLDLGSSNGTYINDDRVIGQGRLRHGDILRVEAMHLQFAEEIREERARVMFVGDRVATELDPADLAEAIASRRRAPTELRLEEAPSGEGGLLVFGPARVHLTLLQFELISALWERWTEEAAEAQSVRGWIRSIELLACLSWATDSADDVNLRHLVRRTRKRLEGSGVAIEAVHGLGYRVQITE